MVYLGAVQGRNIECARQYGEDFRTRMPEQRELMLEIDKENEEAFNKMRLQQKLRRTGY